MECQALFGRLCLPLVGPLLAHSGFHDLSGVVRWTNDQNDSSGGQRSAGAGLRHWRRLGIVGRLATNGLISADFIEFLVD